MNNARTAVGQKLTIPKDNNAVFYENYASVLQDNQRLGTALEDLASNPEFDPVFQALIQHYEETGRAIPDLYDEVHDARSMAKKYQLLIEDMGVGPTKFAQIISNMTDLMESIKAKDEDLYEAINNTRSDCNPTRTIEEAQAELDAAFPMTDEYAGNSIGHRFKIIERLGTASMGETYTAIRPDGSTCVIKMLKRGVDQTQLDLEKQFYTMLIRSFNDNPESAQEQIDMISQCYEDWADELDFTQEYEANHQLAQGAQRYTVASATDVSANGKCLVMDMAQGVQMKKVMKMLKFYTEHPEQYATEYEEDIKKNPWLADPAKILEELPITLSGTFIEQFIFMKDGGQSLMHGDPHMGNYFVYMTAEGNLGIEFIDTGLCIERSEDVIKSDIRFFSNYLVGNSREIATYYIDKCDIAPEDRDRLIDVVTQDISTEIFNQHSNITHLPSVQSAINEILTRHGLSLSPDEATALKAQMQFLTGIADLYHLSGQHFDLNPFFKDLPEALKSMRRVGISPVGEIKPAASFAIHNGVHTMSTALQFIYKKQVTPSQDK